jgi:hypothetical protein
VAGHDPAAGLEGAGNAQDAFAKRRFWQERGGDPGQRVGGVLVEGAHIVLAQDHAVRDAAGGDGVGGQGEHSGKDVQSRGSELERAFPYGIVRQLLERLFTDAERRSRVLTGAAVMAGRLLGARQDASVSAAEVSPFPMLHALFWTVSLRPRAVIRST